MVFREAKFVGINKYALIGLVMAIMFLGFGLLFAIMKEKGSILISGYNFKSKEERKKYDEKRMSKDMRNFFFICSGIFCIGTVMTYLFGVVWFWISLLIFIVYLFKNIHISDEKAFVKYKR